MKRAVVALLCACGAAQRGPARLAVDLDDQFFAGQVEAASVNASRVLATARPGSGDADRALFVLDYAGAAIPPDVAGEMAAFTVARRKVRGATTQAERERAMAAVLAFASEAQHRPPFRAGLIHLAAGLSLRDVVTMQLSKPMHDPRVVAQLEASEAAFSRASAPRWQTFAAIQRLAAAAEDPITAAQPRTSLRLAELGRIARAQNAPILEAVALRYEGRALIFQHAGDGTTHRYAAARKILLRLGRFDLAAETCADQLFAISPNTDSWATTSIRECLGITSRIEDRVLRTATEFRLTSSTYLSLTRAIVFRDMTTGAPSTLDEPARLTEIETALAGQAVELGRQWLRDSTARGEGASQQLPTRMVLAGLLSLLGRHADATDVLAQSFAEVAATPITVKAFHDALVAYASSLERLGRTDDAARAYGALAGVMCSPDYDGIRGGPELYLRAARLRTRAAGLPVPPALPAFNAAPAASRPALEHAYTALRSALACEPASTARLQFDLLAIDIALGDAPAASQVARQYLTSWDLASLHQDRELPSPLELLPVLLATLPPDPTLSAELQLRKDRLAQRRPFAGSDEPP